MKNFDSIVNHQSNKAVDHLILREYQDEYNTLVRGNEYCNQQIAKATAEDVIEHGWAIKEYQGVIADNNARMAHIENIFSKIEEIQNRKKLFNIMYNVGSSKYVVNHHDGVKTHKDGSPFFDIATFKNKKLFNQFQNDLIKKGYVCS